MALLRIFGPAPQAYGTGLEALVLSDRSVSRQELGEKHLSASAFAYGSAGEPAPAEPALRRLYAGADALLSNHDLAEQDIFDAPDYAYSTGGFHAASAFLGKDATIYHLDTSNPSVLKIRTLSEEMARIIRGRIANPRWIAGQMRHGWRGGAEMAQSIDSLFAFAATTGLITERQFDQVYAAILDGGETETFLRHANPDALAAIEGRFAEAIRRGYWLPMRNSVRSRLAVALDADLEAAE